MASNKTPTIDGLNKVFYKAFWNELKESLLKSFYQTKTSDFLIHKGKPL